MAKLIPHREEIVPIHSEPYTPPRIPQAEAPAAPAPVLPPMRPRQREADAPPVAPPGDRHCPRCAQATTFYYDLFQLNSAHVDADAAAHLGLEKHPWVMGVFCGKCRTYLNLLPAQRREAPVSPFTHG